MTERKQHFKPIVSSSETQSNQSVSKISAETEKKSVHFANDYEEVSEAISTWYSQRHSLDELTVLPSEHLYSGDTFVSLSVSEDTVTEATLGEVAGTFQTDPSYGSSTFISLDSSDESLTKSDSSCSDSKSYASSSVFSNSSISDDITVHGVVRTEIVKDIEDLEESEFFSRTDLPLYDSSFATDSDLEDHELVEKKKQDFIETTIKRLQVHHCTSPRSSKSDISGTSEQLINSKLTGADTKNQNEFCRKMIKLCHQSKKGKQRVKQAQDLESNKYLKSKEEPLENYGLSSAVVNRLQLANFSMDKKIKTIERDIENSLGYIQEHQKIEEDLQKKKFISKMTNFISSQNIDDRIQEHNMKMQPILWLADLVNNLPKPTKDSQDILEKYKKQLEERKLQS